MRVNTHAVRCGCGALPVLLVASLGGAGVPARAAGQVGQPPCVLHLSVEFSDEVQNPQDPGFLSSIVGEPGYELTWMSANSDDDAVELRLAGPGPEYNCRDAVERIGKDARVTSVDVLDDSGT